MLATQARASARGRGAQAKLHAARRLAALADRCQRIATQIQQRSRGEKLTDRLVSVADPDARPIRKGKLGKPTSSALWCRSLRSPPTPVAAPAARSCRRPAHRAIGVRTACSARPWPSWTAWASTPRGRAGRRLCPRSDHPDLAGLAPTRTFIAGRAEPGSRRTRRRLARYRTGCEGRISHLKRGSGLRRSRLKGDQGQRIWTGWAVLAYNLDTSPSTPPERIGHPAAPAPCQAHSSQALTPARFSGGSN